MQVATRLVYWKDKFDGSAVRIDATTFDPRVHSDEPWGAPASDDPDTPKAPSKRGRKG